MDGDIIEKYIQIALEHFSKKPYSDVSVNEIIKDAGTGKNYFYSRYENKKGLYIALIDWLSDLKLEIMKDLGHSINTDLFEALDNVVAIQLKLKEVDPKILEFGAMALSKSNQEILGAVKENKEDMFREYVYGSLKKKQEEGIVRTDISLEVLTNYFMKAYIAISGELVLESHDEQDIKDYIRLLLDSFKNKEVTNE